MPTNILGPDFNQAPLVVFDLSGTQLVFRLPSHEGEYTPVLEKSTIDIFNPESYPLHSPYGSHAVVLSKSYWEYHFTDRPFHAGAMNLNLGLVKIPVEQFDLTSLLNRADFENWLLTCYSFDYAPLDKEMEEDFVQAGKTPTPEDFLVYPKKKEDLNTFIQQGAVWCRARKGHPSTGIGYLLSTAITKTHYLEFGIRFPGFTVEEIGSAETIDLLKESYLQEFLKHVRIEYTPETLAEMERERV